MEERRSNQNVGAGGAAVGGDPEDLGLTKFPLCREPWESYYILRRGILPCCHGEKPIARMSEWATAWNSPAAQEIRSFLSRGKLSPYCLGSLGCPIVQKYLAKKREEALVPALSPEARPPFLRFLNRLFFRVPGKIYRRLKKTG